MSVQLKMVTNHETALLRGEESSPCPVRIPLLSWSSERCSQKAPFVVSGSQHSTSCFIYVPLLQSFAEPYHWRVNYILVTVPGMLWAGNTQQRLEKHKNLWFFGELVHVQLLAVNWLLWSSTAVKCSWVRALQYKSVVISAFFHLLIVTPTRHLYVGGR